MGARVNGRAAERELKGEMNLDIQVSLVAAADRASPVLEQMERAW